jgi:hypothetical protein
MRTFFSHFFLFSIVFLLCQYSPYPVLSTKKPLSQEFKNLERFHPDWWLISARVGKRYRPLTGWWPDRRGIMTR